MRSFLTIVGTALVAASAVSAAAVESPVARAMTTPAAQRRQLASLDAEFSMLAEDTALAPLVSEIESDPAFSSAVDAALTSNYAPIESFFGSLEANPTVASQLVSAVGSTTAAEIFAAISSELVVAAEGSATTDSSSASKASSSVSSAVSSASKSASSAASSASKSSSSAAASSTSSSHNAAPTNGPVAGAAAGLAGLALAAFIGI